MSLGRALKVGALAWFAGTFGAMLVGMLAVGGIAGAVVSTFPAALAIYLDAHGLFLYPESIGGVPFGQATDLFGVLPVVLWSLLTLAVLAGAGAVLAARADSSRQSTILGATVAVGYAPAALLSVLWLLGQASRTTDGPVVEGVDISFVVRLAVAGVVVPVLAGGVGGLARWRLSADETPRNSRKR